MEPTIEEYVRKWLFTAGRLELRFSTTPGLVFRDGRYDFPRGAKHILHPLEYFLLIEEGPFTENWLFDVQRFLKVSPDWINGFMECFAEKPPSKVSVEYTEGYQCSLVVLSDLRGFGWLVDEATLRPE